MKRFLTFSLALLCSIFLAFPTVYIGDVNKDGSISIADVTELVSIILGETTSYSTKLADVNQDSSISIADVTELVNIILGNSEAQEAGADTLFIYYTNDEVTYDLPSDWADSLSVSITDGDVSVTSIAENTEYITALSGTCDNGSYTYTGTYKTTLVLNGLTLTSESGAAIDIQDGKRVALELAEGTENTLVDASSGSQKAALYCKGHLEISKAGSLTLTGNKKHALASNEYMLVKATAGTITINSATNDAIHAGQYFKMNGGTIVVNDAVGDGIQAEATSNTTDEDNGQMIINGGSITISLTGDDVSALKSDSLMTITGGTIDVTTTGDDVKALKSKTDVAISGGDITLTQSGGYLVTTTTDTDGNVTYDASYTTGIKSGAGITITDGTLTIDNTAEGGRGMNADGTIDIQGGTLEVNANGNGGILDTSESSSSSSSSSYRVYVSLPTSTSQGGGFGGNQQGGQSSAWGNVYLYDSSDTQIATLTNQTSLSVNGTTTTFYYYDFGEATSGTYYFKSDDYSSKGGGPGGGSSSTYTIQSADITLSLTGSDAYYTISSSYSTSGSTRTYSISDVTSTYSNASTASEEGDTYKSFCVKADGNITITDGTLTLVHSGLISKGIKTDATVQMDGGTIDDTAAGTYMIIGTDPSYCSAVKCQDFIGNGGTLTVTGSGSASRGISTDGTLTINDGTYEFTLTGDGTTYTSNNETEGIGSRGMKSDGNMVLKGGTITINNSAKGGKGIKIGTSSAEGSSGATLTIGDSSTTFSGPTLTVSTTGTYLATASSASTGGGGFGGMGGMTEGFVGSTKAVKCMGAIKVYGGDIYLSTTSDGGEGLESKYTIDIYGGTMESDTYDDAINAASTITFHDGYVWAHASGNDAIDSNAGSGVDGIVIDGGIVIASGTTSPEEAFDTDNGSFTINGGIVIGTGGAQGSSGGSPSSATQAYGVVSSLSLTANTYLSFKNSSGTVIASYKIPQSTNSASVLVSSPKLTSNSSCTLVYGSSAVSGGSNSLWDGVFCTGATLTGGTSKTFTAK